MNLPPISIIDVHRFVDDRGVLDACNTVPLPPGAKRFYLVSNHVPSVRAWHGHRKETKWLLPISGVIIVAAAPLDGFPYDADKIQRAILSAHNPVLLKIPAGYVHGFKTLTDGARLLVFSDAALDESRCDDVRFDASIQRSVFEIKER